MDRDSFLSPLSTCGPHDIRLPGTDVTPYSRIMRPHARMAMIIPPAAVTCKAITTRTGCNPDAVVFLEEPYGSLEGYLFGRVDVREVHQTEE
jgi:hypothetical protein